jgi:hypothetical protein
MSDYDYNKPFTDIEDMDTYFTSDKVISRRYGKAVKAMKLSNKEYKFRYNKFGANNMKPPPSSNRIFSGYLVVRKLGTSDQYETWMPCVVFDEMYSK